MITRFATENETGDWDALISTNPDGGNILQGKEFIEQKAQAGWTPRVYRCRYPRDELHGKIRTASG